VISQFSGPYCAVQPAKFKAIFVAKMFRDLSPSILSWGAVRNTASEKIGEALDALLPILRAAPQLNERLEEAYLTEFFDSTAELHKVPTYEKDQE